MSELPSEMGSFSLREASFLTHISTDSIREHCNDKQLKCYWTSSKGHRRILRESLILFMNNNGIPLDLSLTGKCPQRRAFPPRDFYKAKIG